MPIPYLQAPQFVGPFFKISENSNCRRLMMIVRGTPTNYRALSDYMRHAGQRMFLARGDGVKVYLVLEAICMGVKAQQVNGDHKVLHLI